CLPENWVKFGISESGFNDCACVIQASRYALLFGYTFAAMYLRLPMCVRSGATRPPAIVPRTVWHIAQAPPTNCCMPATASGDVGTEPGALCASSHASYSFAGCATANNRISACSAPQYSAHCPVYSPGSDASIPM